MDKIKKQNIMRLQVTASTGGSSVLGFYSVTVMLQYFDKRFLSSTVT